MDRVRLAIIGAGNIATMHLPGYLADPRCDVVAVCEPNAEKGARKAAEWGIPKVYTDLAECLADDDVDAVEILTPTHLHKEHAIAAARAGKHISIQKPLANSVADGREILAEVAKAGVLFRVFENCCGYEPLRKARELVLDGAIGEPVHVRIKTVTGWSESKFEAGLDPEGYIWRFNDDAPGGHLFDDIVHKFAMQYWLVDRDITRVSSVVKPGPLFFEPAAASFEYEGEGLLGNMEVSHAPDMYIESDGWSADEFFEIQGESGYIWVTRLCARLTELPPVVMYDGKKRNHVTFDDVNPDYFRSFDNAAHDFIGAIVDGTTCDLSGELAVKVLQLCFATYQASMEGRTIDVASVTDKVSPPWWPPTMEKLIADSERESARRGPAA
jgi:predicted dehydrogenase